MKFAIKYALGGGFGGCENTDAEIHQFASRQEAEDYAYEMACQEYEMYDGLHGLRSVEQIMEEDEISDEEEAEEVWADERESWLDWEVEEVKE